MSRATSTLLIAESPLMVLPRLAARVGLGEAVVLQQVYYLSLRPQNDGWVDLTTREWIDEHLPFFAPRTLERIFGRLRDLDLLTSETLPRGRDGGRRTRIQINHDALIELAETIEADHVKAATSRQSGGKVAAKLAVGLPPDWREGSRQIGGSSCKGNSRLKAEKTASQSRRTRTSSTTDSTISTADLEEVYTAWIDSGAATGRTVFDDKRRRIVRQAITMRMAIPQADKQAAINDCVGAVRGWRHSPHHRGENKDRRPHNSLQVLLRDNDQIETFCELERQHGGESGNVAATLQCPGPTLPQALTDLWTPIAAKLRLAVSDADHEIWLSTLHLHGQHDGTLILGVEPGLMAWVGDRFIKVVEAAAGSSCRIVACGGLSPAAAAVAA